MATNPNVTLKRHNGTDIDIIYPKTKWAQVLDIPSTFPPTAHGHDYTSITNLNLAHVATCDYATSAGTATSATYADSAGSAPASDVSGWAKATVKPSYNASEIGGLGASYRWLTDAYINTWNAKQDAIAAGTTAQYWRGDKTWQTMPTSLPASDVYSWAKAVNKPTYTAAEVGAAATTHTHGNADLTGILSAQKVAATAVSTTTPASIVGINLEANAYYQIEIYGTWSKVANGTANAPVFTIAVNNATGTPFWSGVFEWFAAPANSIMVYESNAANITTTTTALGFQIASSTSAYTATHFAMRGNLYTGTSTKTLTLYIANTASTNPVTCDRAYIKAVRLS